MASEFEHYPAWVSQFAQKYLGKTSCQFILHGNIRDEVKTQDEKKTTFVRYNKFLSEELFASRNVVLFYDRSSGLYFRDRESSRDFKEALKTIDAHNGTQFSKSLPVDPVRLFAIVEQYFRLRLPQNTGIAFVIDYAETIVPMLDGGSAGTEDRNTLVTLQKWSHDPLFLAADFTVVLLSENLADLNRKLVQNPHTTHIKVGLPDEKERMAFLDYFAANKEFKEISSIPKPVLSKLTAGLSLINIRGMLSSARENGKKLTRETLSALKKELIEAEAYELLEFVETDFTLDDVAGHHQVKKKLREAAQALKTGRQEVLPMGYLICGPVGTGKTWIVNCFAGEVGIPMVKLKNFRSQWQGVTEGNLEKILSLIQAMQPVAVMIDEADAYLGNRDQSGDSGVSSRVFSQIASFMSNTRNRGKIIWFLMTSRPDLMPVDLKRQGRAEEHIALFHPESREEREELYEVMVKKTGAKLTKNFIPHELLDKNRTWSGADVEAAITRAMFIAASNGRVEVSPSDLQKAFDDFLPPAYPDEIELQTLVAIMECTSKELLPERYRNLDRSELKRDIEELKMMVQ